METFVEGRTSDSRYIEMVWRGRTGSNYAPVCPADVHWNLLFTKVDGRMHVAAEGPLTKALPKTQPEGMEWLVVKFRLGAFIPCLPLKDFIDGAGAHLPEAAGRSFWLSGAAWQWPDYDNMETFVERLVREGALVRDPLVGAVLQNRPHDLSPRSVRRRFLQATGVRQGDIEQVRRAQQATMLLQQGVSILDVVHQTGYADQPHLTRSLKRFMGQTPAQIAATGQSADLTVLFKTRST